MSCTVSSPNYTATNLADLQDCFTQATHSGDIVHLNGTTFNVSSQLQWNAPPNSVFYGNGKTTTVLTDNYASSSAMLEIDTSATGTFRMHDIGVQGGTGDQKFNGIVVFSGQSKQIRVDNCKFDDTTYSGASGLCLIRTFGYLNGVFDNILFNARDNTNCIKSSYDGIDAYAEGDASWAANTDLGGSNFQFIEDCYFTDNASGQSHNVFNDCDHGAKFVARFNVGPHGSVQTHPTGGSVTSRGCRAWEVYCNNFDSTDFAKANYNNAFMSNGTGVILGNSSQVGGGEHFLTLISMRRNNNTYTQYPPPLYLGYCGPAYQTGTVNTVGTAVTKTGGSNFATSWPAGSMIIIGAIDEVSYVVSSVSSTSALTLTASAGTRTGDTYWVGSNMDGNTDTDLGYPCTDAPGRGKGDLLVGNYYDSTKVNQDRGNATPLSASFYPRQASEPIYEWNNTYNCPSCAHEIFLNNGSTDVLVSNRDYYLQNAGTCASGGACTAGVGTGTTLPTSCTSGTGFWKTNEGTWNGGSNPFYTGQGRLYKCTAPNTWTLLYEPYPYPHPLRGVVPETNTAAKLLPMRMVL